ncbi:MAG: outer membrane lipoprotein chaperone LolA [Porticoccaceae bacterium]|jgi:outer membrane lipoprotein carrier protein
MKNCFRSLFSLLLIASLSSHAGGVHQPESSKRLDALLSPLMALSARFEQIVTDEEGYELQTLSGTMIVARPGRVYWKSDAPYEQLVVSDATTLWLYDQDLEQVTVRPFDNDIANTPAVLFIGKVEQLEEKYRVSSLNEGKSIVFTLVPRDPGALYQKLTLTFVGDTPASMSLWDTLGQQTRIDFDDVTLNQPVDASLFSFEIPDGVDVLYDH